MDNISEHKNIHDSKWLDQLTEFIVSKTFGQSFLHFFLMNLKFLSFIEYTNL